MKPKHSERSRRSSTRKSSNTGESHKSRNATDPELKIHDEPEPMKNKQPAHKYPNAVDNFYSTHEAVYSENEKQPPSRCVYVHSHNEAFPKLNNELEKKRNTSKPITSHTNQQTQQAVTQTFITELDWYDQNCIMCSERKRHARLHSNRSRNRDRRTRNSRISKSKRRPPPRRHVVLNKSKSAYSKTLNGQDQKEGAKDENKKEREITSSRSYSSYNSFLSMDHEPMDSHKP